MQVLFPSDPLNPREVEPDFSEECAAARAAGFSTGLIDCELVMRGDAAGATVRVAREECTALYRGWMLKPACYESLYEELVRRGVALVNSPTAYRTCHYLPESYRCIEQETPRSVWLRSTGAVDFRDIHELISVFDDGPLIVKDYVKSQKHYWHEACFIPRASDRVAVERVVRNFLDLQGSDLNEGLVFREFISLKILGSHPRSGMPLAAEVRTFWYDAELILAHRYWDELTAFDVELPVAHLETIAARVPSRFFTMDVAMLENGRWLVVELGDGQVSGLPSSALAPRLFQEIASRQAP
ncbi:MAG TPA: ATP-grasp domain-containing protein [Polyangiaceae bacterium]|nr:ATP-grasp domain-containing protein [Polyangiaceae bacterium]